MDKEARLERDSRIGAEKYDKLFMDMTHDMNLARADIRKAHKMIYCAEYKFLIEEAEHRLNLALENIRRLKAGSY